MENFFYFCLFIFGTMFGSFASVLIYRLKSGESGIMNGRSHCPKCNNVLQALELIPIFSWIKNLGKCYYCKEKVSSIYPLLELSTGALFTFIGYFLIDFTLIAQTNTLEISKLLFWLTIGFISILYTYYDILFFEIHEGIMLSGIILGFIYLSIDTISSNSLLTSFSSIFLSLIIIGGLYTIMTKELDDKYDISIILASIGALYIYKIEFGINLSDISIFDGLLGALYIFIFFFIQIFISKGVWMGAGDLRIAIMVGLLLGTSLVFPGLMITYIAGSIIGITFVIYGKLKNKGTTLNAQIPFGPFLAIGFFVTIFYSNQLLNIMSMYF